MFSNGLPQRTVPWLVTFADFSINTATLQDAGYCLWSVGWEGMFSPAGTSRLQHITDGESLGSWGFLTWLLWLDFLPLFPLFGHVERSPKKRQRLSGQWPDGVEELRRNFTLWLLQEGLGWRREWGLGVRSWVPDGPSADMSLHLVCLFNITIRVFPPSSPF